MEAAWVKPVIWQKLLDYKPSHAFFILGGNDITSTSNPMEIYRCIRRRIDLVQALHPRAFAFAFGILPCARFRDPELTIRELNRQAGIINGELRRKLSSRNVRPPVRLFNPNGQRLKDYTSQLIHLSDEYGSPKIAIFRIYSIKRFLNAKYAYLLRANDVDSGELKGCKHFLKLMEVERGERVAI